MALELKPQLINGESIAPDVSHIETENDDPVDNVFSAKQQRLLSESLNISWQENRPFLADVDIGVFSSPYQPPLVPDMFLSLGVDVPDDYWTKEGRSYFVWNYGKPPDLVIEVVSNRKGGEADRKLYEYARMGVAYYAIYDPQLLVQSEALVLYESVAGEFMPRPDFDMRRVGLSLQIWDGIFDAMQGHWLRFADLDGNLIPSGDEHRIRANQAEQRAEQEHQRAEQERQRAEQAEAEAANLRARLRKAGIDPDSI